MSKSNQFIEEERISLGYLIKRFVYWVRFIFSKWLQIGIGTIAILLLVLAYNYLKPKVYTAKTTFVIDKDGSEGFGDIGSLASLAGVNLGSITEGSVLFQIDNIQELYKSRRMVEKTLLSDVDINGTSVKLIQRLATESDLENKWRDKEVELSQFLKPRELYSRTQDSLLMESHKLVLEKFLFVGKPNRKATILEVGFQHKDEVLAKLFVEKHVQNVNQFYLETKTKKSSSNLSVLQFQADSVKRVLDRSLLTLAEIEESAPNRNPLYKTAQVPYQKALIDVQANGAIYEEIVKQLELAKVAHRNQLPLIQIIDQPRYPLQDNRWKLFKTLVVGTFLGLFLMISYLLLTQVISSALKEVQ